MTLRSALDWPMALPDVPASSVTPLWPLGSAALPAALVPMVLPKTEL